MVIHGLFAVLEIELQLYSDKVLKEIKTIG